MLFGEHAVVYGEPCLVTAVDSRLQVTIEPSDKQGISIETPQSKDKRFVEAAIKVVSRQSSIVRRIKISTHSPFSGRFGFGSSSAVTVAVLKALSLFFNKPLSNNELFDLSFEVVSHVQGVGSGFDVAAASFGGTLYFKKGGIIIEPLSMSWDGIEWVVGYSGVKSNTVELVKQVAKLREHNARNFDRVMHAIGTIVMQAKEAFLKKDWLQLGKLMNSNQDYLRQFGISTEILEKPIRAALGAGALGAKLSGAGGGDCMIALTDSLHKTAVQQAIAKAGGTVMPVSIHAPGVREETTQGKAVTGKREMNFSLLFPSAPSL